MNTDSKSAILKRCSSAPVCGARISSGMAGEIQAAERLGILIQYVEIVGQDCSVRAVQRADILAEV